MDSISGYCNLHAKILLSELVALWTCPKEAAAKG